MTCIIGYIDKDRMYLGGDSAAVTPDFNYYILNKEDEKIFRKGNILFGITGSGRMGQIIRHSFKIPRHPRKLSDTEYICSIFIDALRNCFKESGYSRIRDNEEAGGCFLMLYRGTIYKVWEDFQVGIYTSVFETFGAGGDFAKGALEILKDMEILVIDKIDRALQVSAKYNASVQPPFKVISLPIK